MKYDVEVDGPRPGATLTLNGQEVGGVIAFDTDEEWVHKVCLGDRKGHPQKAHMDPDQPNAMCRVTLRGALEFTPEEA